MRGPTAIERLEPCGDRAAKRSRQWRTGAGRPLTRGGAHHELTFEGRRAMLVVAQDITEQKRSAEALRQSEERYRTLVELSPDAIAIHSQGMVVFANSAGVKLLGATSSVEIIGRSTLDFVHPDSRPSMISRMRRLARGEPVPFVEEKFVRLDGHVIHVEAGAVPFTFHDAPAVQVVIRDISDRKRAETLQAALYRIAELTTSVEDMPAFYRTIHGVVGELMYAENFYLALLDEDTGLLNFEYFVDEVDQAPPASTRQDPARVRPAHRGARCW